MVDELIGNQEIVIKSLGSYIGKVTGIAGGTILGDGSVALIMEIAGIIAKMGGKTVS
ncbi:Chemotaxis protein CheA [compost metagenome]